MMRLASAVVLGAFACGAAAGPETGDPAPPLSVECLIGAEPTVEASLQSLKGKPIVLEFWATWCAPCVAAIPHLNELNDRFPDEDVQFISVTNEDVDVVGDFLERRTIKGWVGLDTDRSLFEAYEIRGIPHTVLIDADGVVQARTHANAVTEAHLRSLIDGDPIEMSSGPTMSEQLELALGRDGPAPIVEVLIRPSTSKQGMARTRPEKAEGTGLTALGLIHIAWKSQHHNTDVQVRLPEQRYDFVVKAPESWTWTTWLRQSVEQSFGVTAAWERQERPVYLLRSTPDTPQRLRQAGAARGMAIRSGRMEAMGYTMSDLASAAESSLHQRVIDETGLDGRYDMSMPWNPRDLESFRDALRSELGLRLVEDRREIDVLVVRAVDG